jgi:predicted RNase H-like HicB family nuclease
MIDSQTRYQLGDLRLMDKYEIIIYWSVDDGTLIAEVPGLPGCMAHGASHEAALGNI